MAKLKRTNNKPHHAMGLMGHAREVKPVKANAHLPQRTTSGVSDHKGYQETEARRNGGLDGGKLKDHSDTRKRMGAEGNSKGLPPHAKPGTGTLKSHGGHAGRGGAGVIGGADSHKGRAKSLPDDISSRDFERLGAD